MIATAARREDHDMGPIRLSTRSSMATQAPHLTSTLTYPGLPLQPHQAMLGISGSLLWTHMEALQIIHKVYQHDSGADKFEDGRKPFLPSPADQKQQGGKAARLGISLFKLDMSGRTRSDRQIFRNPRRTSQTAVDLPTNSTVPPEHHNGGERTTVIPNLALYNWT